MKYICIGRMINTHGIRGEIKVDSYSDFDELRYRKGNTVYILYEGEYIPFEAASFRRHKGFSLVRFVGYDNINDVEKYKNCELFVKDSDREPLAKGEYYRTELIGMMAVDEEGHQIGIVQDVEETNGANHNLRIHIDTKEVLVPYVPDFIKGVDTAKKIITIHVMEGLL